MALTLHSQEVLTPPIASATAIVLRDGADDTGGLAVLLVRRHAASSVLGGAYVFPGGKVDAADAQQTPPSARTPEQLRQALGEPDVDVATAQALFVAAQRETQEEVGLALPLDGLVPWSRWITPRMASISHKRFDTRFFVAALPPGQTAVADNHEATEAVWWSPRQALTRYWDGAIDLAPPQIMTLAELTHCANVAQALAHAAGRQPPLIEPLPVDEDGQRVMYYPGHPKHPVVTAVWPGPKRVVFRNQRFEPDAGLAAYFSS